MRIILSQLANAQFKYMLLSTESEVGALCSGYVTEDKDAVYIQRLYIVEQKITDSEVDFDHVATNMAALRAMKNNEVIIGWIHSHGNYKTFWSEIDIKTIKTLLRFTNKYVVSIVGNHELDVLGRIDYISTSVFGTEEVKCDKVPLSVDYELPEDERIAFQHDLDTLVSKKVYDHEPQLTTVELCDSDIAIREQQIEDYMKYFGMSEEEALEEVDGCVRNPDI